MRKFFAFTLLFISFLPLFLVMFQSITQGVNEDDFIGFVFILFWLIGFGKLSLLVHDWSVKKESTHTL